jgi:hypothetical protein
MAKEKRFDLIRQSMDSVNTEAIKAKEEKTTFTKVTQKEGSKQVFLKKFPIAWHKLIRTMHSGAMSEYVMVAVAEKMKRDGLL